MDPAPFIEMINDSDSEYLNTADRFGEGSQSNDYETSQVTEEKKKESALSVMTVAAAKVADQYKRLEEKWQELQAKRNARLEDVNSLHKKLLGSLAEKIKCQNEFSQQYIRVVESSQAYWLSERGSEKSRPSSHGLTYFPKDVPLKEKEANHKRKVEKLAKDLTESTEKRCKTLEEIVSLLTQDLEEAKNECHSLEKELDETAFSLQETLDIFNLLNSSEEAEEERSTATFVSCGVSVLSENAGQPPNTGSITSTEIRGFVLQKRSTTLLPSCVRDPGNQLRNKSNRIFRHNFHTKNVCRYILKFGLLIVIQFDTIKNIFPFLTSKGKRSAGNIFWKFKRNKT